MLCGGSTGVFIYGYCFYYYFARSDMTGFMQTSFFFGYMLMICYGFFLSTYHSCAVYIWSLQLIELLSCTHVMAVTVSLFRLQIVTLHDTNQEAQKGCTCGLCSDSS